MTMKTSVTTVLRVFGFRSVLVGNAALSAGFIFAYSFFRPGTPHAVIFMLLLAGGFFSLAANDQDCRRSAMPMSRRRC